MSYTYKYPRPALTVDCVIFARDEDRLKLLLIERKNEPFAGQWALPGGFVELDETTEEAACRELKEETGISVNRLKQLYTFDAIERDPRERVISVAYFAFIEISDHHKVHAASDAKDVKWFAIDALPHLAFDHKKIVEMAFKRCFQ